MKIPQYFFLKPPRSAGIKRFEKKKYHKLGFEDEKEKRPWFVILDDASQIEGMIMS